MQVFKKIHGSVKQTTLIISNDELYDILKPVQALEDSNILLKEVTKTIKNKTKKQKGGFLGMLLGTLEAISFGNMLAGKSNVRSGNRNEEGKGMLRAGYGSKKKKILLPPHSLTKFEIQKYYQNEPRFNGVFSRDNLPNKIKIGAYVINLDEYANTSTH